MVIIKTGGLTFPIYLLHQVNEHIIAAICQLLVGLLLLDQAHEEICKMKFDVIIIQNQPDSKWVKSTATEI